MYDWEAANMKYNLPERVIRDISTFAKKTRVGDITNNILGR